MTRGTSFPGDVVVWDSPDPYQTTPHSGIINRVEFEPDGTRLGYESLIQSKNGLAPEAELPFEQLILRYGETFAVYRRANS